MGPTARRPQPTRVVVLGASLAGTFAAAAASGDGRTVTVVERDVLPDAPQPRDGVPQGRQPHALLLRGLRAMEDLLPGLADELRAAGAVELDTGDLAWHGDLGWSPPHPQFRILSATRPLLEHLVLARVRALPGVRLRDGVRVERVRRGRPGDGAPWWVELADGSVEPADLVVDATGRTSRLPVWLAAAGVPTAATVELDARVGYATRLYALEPGVVHAAGVVIMRSPEVPVGGIALPVEDGGWLIGGVGSGARRPPRDGDGFLRFLDDLPDRALADLARAGRPMSEVALHRQTGNRRHHYERLRAWPDGLLVVGDALCAFDPVYGQGITVAACEAQLLRDALARGMGRGAERRLLRRFAAVTDLPWSIATGEDRRYLPDGPPASRVEDLLGRWTRELGRLSTHGDRSAHDAITRVYHLVGSPWLLLQPQLLVAALRARLVGYGPATPRPRILAADDPAPTARRTAIARR